MLLAGGGYSTIFTNLLFNYTDHAHYTLTFHKLSAFCKNLVWVDGYIYKPVDT